MLIAISCGRAKETRPAPARELYTGALFRMQLKWAESIAEPGDCIVILSARYGFVLPDQIVEPYNVKMGEPGCVTPIALQRQIRQRPDLQTGAVLTTCRGTYLAMLRMLFPKVVAAIPEHPPIKYGWQMQWMNNHLGLRIEV
jgi:hypothetical protein